MKVGILAPSPGKNVCIVPALYFSLHILRLVDQMHKKLGAFMLQIPALKTERLEASFEHLFNCKQ